MIVKDFEEKYANKGGIQKLTEMRSLLYTHKYIAMHFEVSQESVRKWMHNFFGSGYDPRPDRKEAIIANMVEFAKNNSKEDFVFAFRGTEYYKESLKEIDNQNIYVSNE